MPCWYAHLSPLKAYELANATLILHLMRWTWGYREETTVRWYALLSVWGNTIKGCWSNFYMHAVSTRIKYTKDVQYRDPLKLCVVAITMLQIQQRTCCTCWRWKAACDADPSASISIEYTRSYRNTVSRIATFFALRSTDMHWIHLLAPKTDPSILVSTILEFTPTHYHSIIRAEYSLKVVLKPSWNPIATSTAILKLCCPAVYQLKRAPEKWCATSARLLILIGVIHTAIAITIISSWSCRRSSDLHGVHHFDFGRGLTMLRLVYASDRLSWRHVGSHRTHLN